ncbi:MAG: hypothetical protein Q8N60_02610 [Candidatus Diapherotrites archaeon]|nr:hypothetical protein [Candidatus Diapherotrites archaeon]
MISAILITMLFDLNAAVYNAFDYAAKEVVPKALQADMGAIAAIGIAVVALIVAVIFFVELPAWILGLFKRFFLLAWIALSAAFFLFAFNEKLLAARPDATAIALLAIGILSTVIAIAILAFAIKHQVLRPKAEKISELKKVMMEAAADEFKGGESQAFAPAEENSAITVAATEQPVKIAKPARAILSFFNEKSALAAFAFVIVVELGVSSGLAVSMPDETIALALLGLCLLASLVFIKFAFKNLLLGLRYLFFGLFFGAAFAIALGHFWSGIAFEELLSLAFFKTSSFTAIIAALIASMLLGAKE